MSRFDNHGLRACQQFGAHSMTYVVSGLIYEMWLLQIVFFFSFFVHFVFIFNFHTFLCSATSWMWWLENDWASHTKHERKRKMFTRIDRATFPIIEIENESSRLLNCSWCKNVYIAAIAQKRKNMKKEKEWKAND